MGHYIFQYLMCILLTNLSSVWSAEKPKTSILDNTPIRVEDYGTPPVTSTIPLYDCSQSHRPKLDIPGAFEVYHDRQWHLQSCQDGLTWNQTLCRCEFPNGKRLVVQCRDYRATSTDPSGKYEQMVNGQWIMRDCALAVSGLVWDQEACQCVWGPDSSETTTGQGVAPCEIMLNMTFENGVKDEAKGAFVEVGRGQPLPVFAVHKRDAPDGHKAAYFSDTALNIWYFAGNELGTSLRVEFRFKMTNDPAQRDRYQIFVSNGCNVSSPGYTTPSLAIGYRAADQSYLLAFETSTARKAIVCNRKLGPYDWHTISLIYEDGALLFRVDDVPCIISQDFSGAVQKTPCPLTIGADPLERESMYKGYLDNLLIARYCRRFTDSDKLGDKSKGPMPVETAPVVAELRTQQTQSRTDKTASQDKVVAKSQSQDKVTARSQNQDKVTAKSLTQDKVPAKSMSQDQTGGRKNRVVTSTKYSSEVSRRVDGKERESDNPSKRNQLPPTPSWSSSHVQDSLDSGSQTDRSSQEAGHQKRAADRTDQDRFESDKSEERQPRQGRSKKDIEELDQSEISDNSRESIPEKTKTSERYRDGKTNSRNSRDSKVNDDGRSDKLIGGKQTNQRVSTNKRSFSSGMKNDDFHDTGSENSDRGSKHDKRISSGELSSQDTSRNYRNNQGFRSDEHKNHDNSRKDHSHVKIENDKSDEDSAEDIETEHSRHVKTNDKETGSKLGSNKRDNTETLTDETTRRSNDDRRVNPRSSNQKKGREQDRTGSKKKNNSYSGRENQQKLKTGNDAGSETVGRSQTSKKDTSDQQSVKIDRNMLSKQLGEHKVSSSRSFNKPLKDQKPITEITNHSEDGQYKNGNKKIHNSYSDEPNKEERKDAQTKKERSFDERNGRRRPHFSDKRNSQISEPGLDSSSEESSSEEHTDKTHLAPEKDRDEVVKNVQETRKNEALNGRKSERYNVNQNSNSRKSNRPIETYKSNSRNKRVPIAQEDRRDVKEKEEGSRQLKDDVSMGSLGQGQGSDSKVAPVNAAGKTVLIVDLPLGDVTKNEQTWKSSTEIDNNSGQDDDRDDTQGSSIKDGSIPLMVKGRRRSGSKKTNWYDKVDSSLASHVDSKPTNQLVSQTKADQVLADEKMVIPSRSEGIDNVSGFSWIGNGSPGKIDEEVEEKKKVIEKSSQGHFHYSVKDKGEISTNNKMKTTETRSNDDILEEDKGETRADDTMKSKLIQTDKDQIKQKLDSKVEWEETTMRSNQIKEKDDDLMKSKGTTQSGEQKPKTSEILALDVSQKNETQNKEKPTPGSDSLKSKASSSSTSPSGKFPSTSTLSSLRKDIMKNRLNMPIDVTKLFNQKSSGQAFDSTK